MGRELIGGFGVLRRAARQGGLARLGLVRGGGVHGRHGFVRGLAAQGLQVPAAHLNGGRGSPWNSREGLGNGRGGFAWATPEGSALAGGGKCPLWARQFVARPSHSKPTEAKPHQSQAGPMYCAPPPPLLRGYVPEAAASGRPQEGALASGRYRPDTRSRPLPRVVYRPPKFGDVIRLDGQDRVAVARNAAPGKRLSESPSSVASDSTRHSDLRQSSRYGRGAGGFGMTPWCDDLVCSWRRLLADRHSLPFPWTLSLHRRWCPSASHHPLTFLFLHALTFPLPFPWPFPP